MERTIRVRENIAEITNDYFPVILSGRKQATVRGDGNRPYPSTVPNNRANLCKSECVQERD